MRASGGRDRSIEEARPVSRQAAITINRLREGVERLWQSSDYRAPYVEEVVAPLAFSDAPGDRGTEIHVDLEQSVRGGKLGEMVQKAHRLRSNRQGQGRPAPL